MLDKKDFLEIIDAYLAEEKIKDDFTKFLDTINSSYTVLNETPAQTMLLKILEKEFNDKGEVITWYMFEDVEHDIDIENIGTYKLRDFEDLYDYLTIMQDPEDDCAYFISKKLVPLKREGLPADENKMYSYICDHTDEVIKLFEGSDNLKTQNIVLELKALKDAIEKDERRKIGG